MQLLMGNSSASALAVEWENEQFHIVALSKIIQGLAFCEARQDLDKLIDSTLTLLQTMKNSSSWEQQKAYLEFKCFLVAFAVSVARGSLNLTQQFPSLSLKKHWEQCLVLFVSVLWKIYPVHWDGMGLEAFQAEVDGIAFELALNASEEVFASGEVLDFFRVCCKNEVVCLLLKERMLKEGIAEAVDVNQEGEFVECTGKQVEVSVEVQNLISNGGPLGKELKRDKKIVSLLLEQPISCWNLSLHDLGVVNWDEIRDYAALFVDYRYFSGEGQTDLAANREALANIVQRQIFESFDISACAFVEHALKGQDNLGNLPLELLKVILNGCKETTLARSICLNSIGMIPKEVLLKLFLKYSSILFPFVFQAFSCNENILKLICSSLGLSVQKFIDKGMLNLFPLLFFSQKHEQELQILSRLKGIDYATFFISNIHILIAHAFLYYHSQEVFDQNLKRILDHVSCLSGSVVSIQDILKANFQDVLKAIFILVAAADSDGTDEQHVERKKKALNSIAQAVLPEVFSSHVVGQLLKRCFLGIFYALNEDIKNSSHCEYEKFILMTALYEMMICVSNADLAAYLAHIVPLIESTGANYCDSPLFSSLLSRFWCHILPVVGNEEASLGEFFIFFQRTRSPKFEHLLSFHKANPKISLLFFSDFSLAADEIFQILGEFLTSKFELVQDFALSLFLEYFHSSFAHHALIHKDVPAARLISCQKALFNLCKNPKLSQKACEVFSYLGFVEEDALLNDNAISQVSSQSFHIEYLEGRGNILDYSSNLIESFLLPHFKSSRELAFQDRLAFAIQELCRCVGFSSFIQPGNQLSSMKPFDLVGYDSVLLDRWEAFDSLVKENLHPFLKAKYTISLPKFSSAKEQSCVNILSSASFSYKEWIFVFYSNCLAKLSCGFKADFFSPFRAIINSELEIIPQIISTLVLCVIHDAKQRESNIEYVLSEFNGSFSFLSRQESLLPGLKRVVDILFTIIDSQRIWVKTSIQKGQKLMVKKTNAPSNPALSLVRRVEKDFFSRLDKESACLLAFKSGNMKRALMFLENQFTSSIQSINDSSLRHQFISDKYKILNQIYSSLNAKADLKEIIQCFHRDPQDMRVIYEMENDWRNCLSLVQSNPADQEELDKCLYMLGMDEVILSKSQKITEFAARSIINLQRWDLILATEQQAIPSHLELVKKILTKSFSLQDAFVPNDFSATSFNMSLYDDLNHCPDLQAKRSRVINFDNYDKMFGYHLAIDSSQQISKIWLERAKIARKARLFDLAKNSLLRIPNQFDSPAIIMEKSRILWHQGQKIEALQLLKSGQEVVPVKFNCSTATFNAPEADYLKCKIARLVAKWMDELQIDNSIQVLNKIREAIYLDEKSEKAHYMFAKYYYKLYLNQMEKNHISADLNSYVAGTNYAVHVIRSFTRSLFTGSKFIYESLPRLLNIWLDVSVKYYGQYKASHDQTLDEIIRKMEHTIEKLCVRLAPWQIYIGLSLLIARFNQPTDATSELVCRILIILLQAYPDQTMWFLFSQARSSNTVRKGKFYEILGKLKATKGIGPEFLMRINQCLGLFEALLQISNYIPTEKNSSSFTLSSVKEFKYINQRMFPLDWIIPLTESLVPTLPNNDSCSANWNAFPALGHSQIICLKDSVEVLNSLQRPKKITLIAGNGREYEFLCKPKDDLRTDARVMEFFTLVNKFCQKDRSTNDIGIHTYCVLPLNEECGIIEWVPKTICYRTALNSIYALKGIEIPSREELAKIYEMKLPLQQIFTQKLLPRFPTVFNDWFMFQFGGDPAAWWSSKQAYTKTLATMSMVGAILGLGDRHGENIMLDEQTGKVIHVDFNCLFEKGLKFAKPERVPFRMTHNVEGALGILGCQGSFKAICIKILAIMRSNRDMLLSNLETFLHDPIIDFAKRKTHALSEIDEALKCVSLVGKKLKGHIEDGLPFSVEGQAEELIKMATDVQKLSEMFIGWAAYL